MSKHAGLDEYILGELSPRSMHLLMLIRELRDNRELLETMERKPFSWAIYGLVSRRLQALKKAGKIKYDTKRGWVKV